MAFAEFPKAMHHPAHRSAVLSKDEVINGKIIKAPPGSPERFPDVFVNNADQEQQYAALGYLPNGVSDPEAYRRAMTNNEEPPNHSHREYPRYMYQADDAGDILVSIDFDTVRVRSVLVSNESERLALSGAWFEMPMQAARAELDDDGEEDGADGHDQVSMETMDSPQEQQPFRRPVGRPRKNPIEVA